MSFTRITLVALAACVLVVAAYANFFDNDFHLDDNHAIVQNAAIRSLGNVPLLVTDLAMLSFAVDYAIGGLDPVPFHATQLVLLLLVALMLVPIFARIFDDLALAIAAATLFAVHTANTETMNFLSSRNELLAAIGFLGALLLFLTRPGYVYLVPLVLAALAKAPVVIFAGIVFAWMRLIEGGSLRQAVRESWPSFVLGVALSPLYIADAGAPWRAYLITQPFVWMHYFRLAIAPIGLTADSDWRPFASALDGRALVGFTFVSLLAWAIFATARRREWRAVSFGLCWFAVALLPTSLVPLAEVKNEHRLFFPLIGVVLAAVCALRIVLARREPARTALVVVAAASIVLTVGTFVRNEAWATEESLWRDVTEKSPRNGRGWMNFGLTRMAAGDYPAAKQAFEQAAVLTPRYPVLEINRGIVDGALGEKSDAETHFRAALALEPDASAHYYYGRWLLKAGRGPEAVAQLLTASKLAPGWLGANELLLQIAAARGDAVETNRILAIIAAIDPNDDVARAIAERVPPVPCHSADDCYNAAAHLAAANEHLSAARQYRHVLDLDPNSSAAGQNLAASLTALGFPDEAAFALRLAN